MALKDLAMPPMADESMPAEDTAVSPLADFSDDELVEELKKRGFDVESPEVEASEPAGEDVAEMTNITD